MYNFVIPIKHTDLINDINEHKKYLSELLASIKNNIKNNEINIFLVCPDDYVYIDESINIVKVNYPKPDQNLAKIDVKKYYQQFRIDKGSKIFEVYEKIKDEEWIIPLDDDDLISKNYMNVIKKINKDIFIIECGYKWYPLKKVLEKEERIDKFCGSTIGFRKKIMKKYEIRNDFIEILGSHSMLKQHENDYIKIKKFLVLWRLENSNSSQELLWKNLSVYKKIKKYIYLMSQSLLKNRYKGSKYKEILNRDFKCK
jgi:hypothetical protein